MEINEVKQKIQHLIDKAVSDNESQKKTLKFLFNKLEEVKELETIDRLRQFQNGNRFLHAYLVYKSITRANYQPELLKQINFWESAAGQFKLLEAINADIEQFIKDTEKCEKLPEEQPSNSQLIEWINERRKTREIYIERDGYGDIEVKENEDYIEKKADEFLEKHGISAGADEKDKGKKQVEEILKQHERN